MLPILPRVFVASSSGKGRIIAEAFVRYADGKFCNFYPWWDHTTFKYGNSITTEIAYLCRNKIDYGLIFLTDDDKEIEASTSKDSPPAEVRISKNCFIEWGICVGALGLDRTIGFTNINPDLFPIDMKNIKFNQFDDPIIENSLSREEKIKKIIAENDELMKEFAVIIEGICRKKDTFYITKPVIEVIPQALLFEFEQPEDEKSKSFGKLKQKSLVEVALKQPVEFVDKEIALKIIANCTKGIRYDYIYTIDMLSKIATPNTIAESLKTLLKAYEEDNLNEPTLLANVKTEKLKKFIQLLRKQINFYFEFTPFTFEYCIHTYSGDVDENAVYLKCKRRNFSNKEKIYYARLYNSVNEVEIINVQTKLLAIKDKYKPSEDSLFVALKETKSNKKSRANYSNFITATRNRIESILKANGYESDVIDEFIKN
jgi:hypothetical protein